MPRYTTALEALNLIQSGHRVFVHGAAATPNFLLNALIEHAPRLTDVELIHLHTEGPAHYASETFRGHFNVVNLFVGENMRNKIDFGRIDYLPSFLSDMPALFQNGHRPIDVALLHVSTPDERGYCSLGVSVDVARAAAQNAKIVIAQMNPRMPYVHGNGFIHIDRFNAIVDVNAELPEPKYHELSDIEIAIGRHVAGLVEDGSCLQVGIGSIPNAVLRALRGHRHLGLHSEMWSDGVLDLIEAGALDNSKKTFHPGKCVSGFIMGSRRVYDFIDNNESVLQLGSEVVNDPQVISRNSKVAAINSAVEVDLSGQICADSIGSRIISGAGGQIDFLRGAHLSDGGKPIIALPSRTKRGESRIVVDLKRGAGVVTTRGHAHFVATEYGVADLAGKTLGERAKALIGIAHPEDRDGLLRQWRESHH